jgi:hypothetical protein
MSFLAIFRISFFLVKIDSLKICLKFCLPFPCYFCDCHYCSRGVTVEFITVPAVLLRDFPHFLWYYHKITVFTIIFSVFWSFTTDHTLLDAAWSMTISSMSQLLLQGYWYTTPISIWPDGNVPSSQLIEHRWIASVARPHVALWV